MIKRILLLFAFLSFSAVAFAQQGQVVAGYIGTTGTAKAINVDASGNILTNPTVASGLLPYTGTGYTLTTIATTSATVPTANTMTVNSLYIGNSTASAATITIADNTSGTALYTTFSIPANSVLEAIAPGTNIVLAGLKLTAGTANALNYIVSGWTKTGS